MAMRRRDLLSASAAAIAAGSGLGRRAWAAPAPRDADIVVVGAGAAGIAAARRVQAANRKVIVVETDLRDDDERLVARVTQTQMVLGG